jgi:hypothetical protein
MWTAFQNHAVSWKKFPKTLGLNAEVELQLIQVVSIVWQLIVQRLWVQQGIE